MTRILVTNDDGVFSEGIKLLAEKLRPLAEVLVVAPDRVFRRDRGDSARDGGRGGGGIFRRGTTRGVAPGYDEYGLRPKECNFKTYATGFGMQAQRAAVFRWPSHF